MQTHTHTHTQPAWRIINIHSRIAAAAAATNSDKTTAGENVSDNTRALQQLVNQP